MAAYRYYRPRYHYRGYRRGQVPKPVLIGAATLLAIGTAGTAQHAVHHHPQGAHPAHAATLAVSGSYTPATWAQAFLAAASLPVTACNIAAVTGWENAEGGNWGNNAAANPLDTTQTEPGSYPINSVGVQAFPSWRAGLAATVTTLNNGRYPAIISALQAGNNAQAVASAVASSVWGTGPFTPASC